MAVASGPDLKRLVLELGGNDPAIVLPDVDVEAVAEGIFWGAFENSGQVCQAIKRLYVHDEVYDSLLEAMVERAENVKMGDPMAPGTQLGPVNNRPQFDRVLQLVADARQRGARVVAGGEAPDGSGYFYPPTLVTDIPDDAPLVTQEQFGPVLPILRYTNVDDAIRRANATRFGLGTGWINQHNTLEPDAPLGGMKWSGMGYQNGRWGLDEFCALQVVSRKPNPK